MPAPYLNKHFLEMSEQEREARRLAALERPGRDAIENVYPETELLPAFKGLKNFFRPKPSLEDLANIRIGQSIQNLEKTPILPISKAEIDTNVGTYEKAIKAFKEEQKRKEYLQNSIDKYILEKNKERAKEALQRRRVEAPQRDMEKALFNTGLNTGFYQNFGRPTENYKKGGKVLFKGDGIAKRGKTRGRMV